MKVKTPIHKIKLPTWVGVICRTALVLALLAVPPILLVCHGLKNRTLAFTTGTSMLPTFGRVGLYHSEPYVGQSLKVGDIVGYKDFDGVGISHRITAVWGNGVECKGDNNSRQDTLIIPFDRITRVIGDPIISINFGSQRENDFRL